MYFYKFFYRLMFFVSGILITVHHCHAATITYASSSTIIANPERGLYRYVETRASNPTPYDLVTLQDYRNVEKITLIYCINYLDEFANTTINATFLQHIRGNLATVRKAGLKCILRFAYSDDDNGGSPPFGDASKTRILAHLDQLQPILAENADVIALLQAGFIGVWGEWYYTDYFVDNPSQPDVISAARWADRAAVVNKLLAVMPTTRMIALRTPQAKQTIFNTTTPLTVAQAYKTSGIARTGYHNDCFLASLDDFGTFLDSDDAPYMAAETNYVAMGGETCNPNPPRSLCPIALQELARYHWSYLNAGYEPNVLQSWTTGGCLTTIKQKLGYRLVLLQGSYDNAVRPGQQFNISVSLTNSGWAAPFNPRPVQLLLRNTLTKARYAVSLPQDPRTWQPGKSFTLSHGICVPATVPIGNYELLLNLPDPQASLRQRSEYAILFANGGGVQESATGYNRLLQTIAVSATAPAKACTSTLWLAPN